MFMTDCRWYIAHIPYHLVLLKRTRADDKVPVCVGIYASHAYICSSLSPQIRDNNMQDGSPASRQHKSTIFNYAYICIFLLQLFVVVACGSYINVAIACVSWTILLVSGHEHNIVVSVLCGFSVVLQTYAMSINSQQVLLVSTVPQRPCDNIGIVAIESLYKRENIFKSCNQDLFVPFVPYPTYALEQDSNMQLMYGGDVAVASAHMRFASCYSLGLSCYRWKIRLDGFGTRDFVPCWPLVQHVHVTNASAVVMVQHKSNKALDIYNLDLPIPPALSPVSTTFDFIREARFVHLSSRMPLPLSLVDTTVLGRQALETVEQVPTGDTVFVVIPTQQGQTTSLKISIRVQCEKQDTVPAALPFFHSGAMHLAIAATPTVYTVYAAFSECGPESNSACNSRIFTSFAVYVSNVALCVSCLLLTHGCQPHHTHQYSVLYIFAFTVAAVTFNWVAMICIYCVHPASMHGGFANLNRSQQVVCHALHVAQLVFLAAELAENQIGNNPRFMMSRMHGQSVFGHVFLPFTLLDSNIYVENCALYVWTNIFIAYLLYYKCRA